jgi:hypothetical protein
MISDVPPAHDEAELVSRALCALDAGLVMESMRELNAPVSTNRVYLLRLASGREVVAKTSSFGSYVHFRQDHQIIKQWERHLGGTRFRSFLSSVVTKDGEAFTYRDAEKWVVFYEKARFYDFLPKVLTSPLVRSLGSEMAAFHAASTVVAPSLTPSWKSVGSDVANLFDALGSAEWRAQRGLDRSAERLLREQCETFLSNAERLGYHSFAKIPLLIDWNITNFSVGFDGDGFRFFSRWDYDWFRIEPRIFDLYFCARVARSEGDQTAFTYNLAPLFEAPFIKFLRSYHAAFPLADEEVLFLKEAYRFFLLNYVVRSGEHFFQSDYSTRLLDEAVKVHFPALEAADFMPLVRALT